MPGKDLKQKVLRLFLFPIFLPLICFKENHPASYDDLPVEWRAVCPGAMGPVISRQRLSSDSGRHPPCQPPVQRVSLFVYGWPDSCIFGFQVPFPLLESRYSGDFLFLDN